ncbi:hypothetical protein LTR28_011851, partial [Elasticomyces elasticus]
MDHPPYHYKPVGCQEQYFPRQRPQRQTALTYPPAARSEAEQWPITPQSHGLYLMPYQYPQSQISPNMSNCQQRNNNDPLFSTPLQPVPVDRSGDTLFYDLWPETYCQPAMSFLPSASPFPQTATADRMQAGLHEPSPEPSVSSFRSPHSALSSPYPISELHAHSDPECFNTPYIKREETLLWPSEYLGERPTPHARTTTTTTSTTISPAQLALLQSATMDPTGEPSVLPDYAAYTGDLAHRAATEGATNQAQQRPPPLFHSRALSATDVHEAATQQERMRKKRRFTTEENANCGCGVCGKFFQRSYNLKAHMQTHDPGRAKEHGCGSEGCERVFSRRTDLVRHEMS